MSIEHMTTVWKYSRQEGARLLLLLALADFANDNGLSWPSIATLADRTRSSERTVIRHLQALEESKELEVTRRLNKVSLYRLAVCSGVKLSPLGGDKPCGSGDRAVSHDTSIDSSPIKPKPLIASLFSEDVESLIEKYCAALYRAFPKHAGKKDALPAIRNAITRLCKEHEDGSNKTAQAAFEYLATAVALYAADLQRRATPEDKIKWPQGWFNDSRYLDLMKKQIVQSKSKNVSHEVQRQLEES